MKSTPHANSKGITILGATGTIGVNTLDVIKRHPHRFHVVALTANQDMERLFTQCVEFKPDFAVLVKIEKAHELQSRLHEVGCHTEVLAGSEALELVASLPKVDYVMAAIVGAAGLLPTVAAARAGKRVLLANKEALVMSGQLFMQEIRDNQAELLPIDSEHNAVFQCIPQGFENGLAEVGVERVLLTASGGPFRTMPIDRLKDVTPEQACAHPQSVIHSLVAYTDGSVLAQLGNPDMRTPIAYALAWPERVSAGVKRLDLISVARLDFELPDLERFPCLRLAQEALEAGGTATAILNAANEVAVERFLKREINFTDIPRVISKTLDSVQVQAPDSIDTIMEVNRQARQRAREQQLPTLTVI